MYTDWEGFREKTFFIPMEQLVVGSYYIGISNRATLARWEGENFVYIHFDGSWYSTGVLGNPEISPDAWQSFYASDIADINLVADYLAGTGYTEIPI